MPNGEVGKTKVFRYNPEESRVEFRVEGGQDWNPYLVATVIDTVTGLNQFGDPQVLSALILDTDKNLYYVTAGTAGGPLIKTEKAGLIFDYKSDADRTSAAREAAGIPSAVIPVAGGKYEVIDKPVKRPPGTIVSADTLGLGLPKGLFVITDPDGSMRIWTPEKTPDKKGYVDKGDADAAAEAMGPDYRVIKDPDGSYVVKLGPATGLAKPEFETDAQGQMWVRTSPGGDWQRYEPLSKKGYKDQAVADAVAKALGPDYRAIQLPDDSWNVVQVQPAEKKGLAEPEFRKDAQGQMWVRTSPEGAWQRYEAPSLEDMETQKLLEGRIEEARAYRNFRLSPTPEAAMRLALDIQKSPGDWWTYLGMLYGDQANKPYTGAQAVPRTWATQLAGMLGLQLPGEVPQFGVGAGGTVPPDFGQAQGQRPRDTGAPVITPPGAGGMLGAGGLLPGQVLIRSPSGQLQARTREAADALLRLPGYAELDPATGAEKVSPLRTSGMTGALAAEPPMTPQFEAEATGEPNVSAEVEQALFPANVPVKQAVAAVPEDTYVTMEGEPSPGEYETVTVPIGGSEEAAFANAGYTRKKTSKLMDWAAPLFGPVSGMAPNWGIRRALTGQVVNRGRPLPTIGAPVFPSAQSWANLAPSEQSMFTSEVQRIGIPIEDYLAQWRATMPSWNTSGTFRRVPSFLGPVA